ncbi:uncharacterized protein LY79DRAFT_181945 [Colletotrichum navitas]|uniref:Uncharacterized protein n=1 Tax=Colletotrichum navitas TaxID=681940 RepID=A0AAD8PZW3_9PEZI|nr:uncharacterized protein LY79DRAFT_181945 [Colletotrichum navitas]KAK1593266.1 hypothetical protein LY79DRAFT_181945 [Colletotrichum navitas]
MCLNETPGCRGSLVSPGLEEWGTCWRMGNVPRHRFNRRPRVFLFGTFILSGRCLSGGMLLQFGTSATVGEHGEEGWVVRQPVQLYVGTTSASVRELGGLVGQNGRRIYDTCKLCRLSRCICVPCPPVCGSDCYAVTGGRHVSRREVPRLTRRSLCAVQAWKPNRLRRPLPPLSGSVDTASTHGR